MFSDVPSNGLTCVACVVSYYPFIWNQYQKSGPKIPLCRDVPRECSNFEELMGTKSCPAEMVTVGGNTLILLNLPNVCCLWNLENIVPQYSWQNVHYDKKILSTRLYYVHKGPHFEESSKRYNVCKIFGALRLGFQVSLDEENIFN